MLSIETNIKSDRYRGPLDGLVVLRTLMPGRPRNDGQKILGKNSVVSCFSSGKLSQVMDAGLKSKKRSR